MAVTTPEPVAGDGFCGATGVAVEDAVVEVAPSFVK